MWCPSCRDEFRAGFTRCADCDVDLVATRPPAPVRVREGTHRALPTPEDLLVEFDLADWPDDERAGLELRLRMAEIPFEWDDGLLIVNHALQVEVADLIEFVDDVEEQPAPVAAGHRAGDATDPLASPGRRFLGYVVDALVFAVVLVPVRVTHPSRVTTIVLAAALAGLYNIVPVALTGRTPGKVVVRTRVRRTDGDTPPGWSTAAVRWAVPAVGVLLWPLGAVGAWINLAWTLAVYLPIFGARRQGLHDRAAHTVVTFERSRA
jgi:hypothetical protein